LRIQLHEKEGFTMNLQETLTQYIEFANICLPYQCYILIQIMSYYLTGSVREDF